MHATRLATLVAAAAALSTALLIPPIVTHAALVTWTFRDVPFHDGGRLTGWFVFDADLLPPPEESWRGNGRLIAFDISTTLGTFGVTPFEYTPTSAGFNSTNGPSSSSMILGVGHRQLELLFGSPLTDAGGTVRITLSPGDSWK